MGLIASAVSAAKARFRPILMTVLTMIFGLFPLVVATGVGANGTVHWVRVLSVVCSSDIGAAVHCSCLVHQFPVVAGAASSCPIRPDERLAD